MENSGRDTFNLSTVGTSEIRTSDALITECRGQQDVYELHIPSTLR